MYYQWIWFRVQSGKIESIQNIFISKYDTINAFKNIDFLINVFRDKDQS